MHNFFRAVRLALVYRCTLAGSILASLAVAVLWGGNLGTVYPFVEVVFRGQSLHEWVDDRICQAQEAADEFGRQVAELERQQRAAAPGEAPALARRMTLCQSRQAAELQAVATARGLQPYIHRWMPATPFGTLLLIVALLLAGTLLKGAFIVANLILVERLAQLATFDLRKDFYRRTLRMDLGSFGDDRTSRLLSHFTHDLGALTTGVGTLFGRAVREPLKMLACFAGAAFICWRLLLFSLIVSPLALLVMNRLARAIKRANRRAMEEMSQLYNHLAETFMGIQAVKAFTMERFERHRFHHFSKEYFHKSMRIAVYDALAKPATEMLGIGVICLAILAGGYLVLNQETHLLGLRMSNRPLSLGALMAFYALLAGISDPARKLADVYSQLQRGAAAADRIYEKLDREPVVVEAVHPQRIPEPWRELVLDHVSFHYVTGLPVLQDISFRLRAGETVAVVGANGCGKTSLANLLPRFYDPTAGAVRLNGVDLRQLRLRDLRRRIGTVTQHTLLFDDTILNNIRYGSPGASDEEVVEAARKANAHQFITSKLEHGYDTIVGQSGSRLSGGQRQRIALARAILRDPAILILDEATSQVDLESEQLIHQALQQFIRGRMTLIITHRLSTLALADRVLVLDAGRLVDLGTHAELLTRCELYSRLHEAHFKRTA